MTPAHDVGVMLCATHALRPRARSARIADTSLLAAFMLLRTVASAALLALLLPAAANAAYRSPQQILDSAPASAWRVLDPARTLYLELDAGRVIIELAPQFAPEHVGNIRTLAHERFWDGLSIYRAQDNFVVQFGDPDGETPGKAKSLGSAKGICRPNSNAPRRAWISSACPIATAGRRR